MEPFNWTCPYCGRDQVVHQLNHTNQRAGINSHRSRDVRKLDVVSITCANDGCGRISLTVYLWHGEMTPSGHWQRGNLEGRWSLLPIAAIKPLPDYIPLQLRQDYEEACKIAELSPKASATLARRCLQGMIRDFCGIQVKGKRLVDEISELERRIGSRGRDPNIPAAPDGVSSASLEAIDAVRKIGNIGAHMEQDVDLIIDIDPEEARYLIALIESLFDDWYVERYKREKRFAEIRKIADAKDQAKKAQSVPANA